MRHVDTLTYFEHDTGMHHIYPRVFVGENGHPTIALFNEYGNREHEVDVADLEEVDIWERDFDFIVGQEIRESLIKWWNREEHTCCDPILHD